MVGKDANKTVDPVGRLGGGAEDTGLPLELARGHRTPHHACGGGDEGGATGFHERAP
jgi:hypothetical protein